MEGRNGPVTFHIKEFKLDMLPLDHDVISLDINSAFTVSKYLALVVVGSKF